LPEHANDVAAKVGDRRAAFPSDEIEHGDDVPAVGPPRRHGEIVAARRNRGAKILRALEDCIGLRLRGKAQPEQQPSSAEKQDRPCVRGTVSA
jgi:hypothetical protein